MPEQAHISEFLAKVDGFVGPVSTIETALNSVTGAANRTTSALIKFDSAGNEVGRTVKLTDDGLKSYTISLQKTEEGHRVLSASVSDTNRKMGDFDRSVQQIAKNIDNYAASLRKVENVRLVNLEQAERDGQRLVAQFERQHNEILAKEHQFAASMRTIQSNINNITTGAQRTENTRLRRLEDAEREGERLVAIFERNHNRIVAEEQRFAARMQAIQTNIDSARKARVERAFADLNDQQNAASAQRFGDVTRLTNVGAIRAQRPEDVLRVMNAITGIQERVASGALTAARATEVMNRALAGSPQVLNASEREVAALALQTRVLGDTTQRAGRAMLNLNDIARISIIQLLHRAIYGFIADAQESIQAAIQFQIQISNIRTISQDSSQSFEQWSNSIRKLSDEFNRPIADVAKAAYETISNQIAKGAEATTFLEKALRFSQATVSTTAESVDLLSSAINAYGLKATDVERVSATLFKTIDLGRTTASEMANTFGRVAVPASQLGISLEELAGGIATLTINGVKTSETFTQLNTLMTAFLKPSEDMKKLFKEWGVESGETAIATFGFAGTLRKLAEATKGSSTELAGLVRNARGLRGAQGLLGDFQGLENTIQKIQSAGPQYTQAIAIATESAGFQVDKELNKIKNKFISEFGTPFITVLASISKSFGGLDNALNIVYKSVGTTVGIWAAYRLALLASSRTTVILTTQSLTLSQVIGKTVAAALATVSSLATGIGAAYLAYSYFEDRRFAKIEEAKEKFAKANEEEIEKFKFSQEKQRVAFVDGITKRYQVYFQYAADVQKLSRQTTEAQVEHQKVALEKLKAILDNFLDRQKDGIRSLEQEQKRALEEVKKAQEELIRLQGTGERRDFERRIALAPEEDRQTILLSRLDDVKRQSTQLADLGHVEASTRKIQEGLDIIQERFRRMETARKRILEIEKEQLELSQRQEYINEKNDLQEDIRNRRKSKNRNLKGLTNELGELGADEAERRAAARLAELDAEKQRLQKDYGSATLLTAAQDNLRYKREENELLKVMQANVDLLAQKEAERAKANEAIIRSEHIRTFQLQEVFKKIGAFKLNDKVTEQSLSKSLGAFDTLIKRSELLGADAEVIKELWQQRAEIAETGGQQITKRNIEETVRELENIKKQYIKTYETINSERIKILEEKGTFQKTALERTEEIRSELTSIRAESFVKDYLAKVINPAIEEMFAKADAGDIAAFQGSNNAIKKILTSKSTILQRTVDKEGEISVGMGLQEIEAQFAKMAELQNRANQANNNLEITKIKARQAGAAIDGIGEASISASKALQDNLVPTLDGLNARTSELIQRLEHLRMDMESRPKLPTGNPGYFSSGSFTPVGRAQGSDTVPAWLTPGEFVMNRQATAAFYPILRAMNMQQRPQYFAQGGEVNFSGVEINIQSSGSAQVDAQSLWREFEYLGRRGLIKMRT